MCRLDECQANLKIHGLRWTSQEKAQLDAEFEEKMRNLENDKEEDLLRINASSLVGENVRQCYENYSA